MRGWSIRHEGRLIAWFAEESDAHGWAAAHGPQSVRWGDRVHQVEPAPDHEALEQARASLLSLRGALEQEREKCLHLEREVRQLQSYLADSEHERRQAQAELRALDVQLAEIRRG